MIRSRTGVSHHVSRPLVERVRLLHDVGLLDLLGPVIRADLLERDRDGLLAQVESVRHVPGYRLGEPDLLLFGRTRPEFHDDMRHCWLLLSLAPFGIAGHTTVIPPSTVRAWPMT